MDNQIFFINEYNDDIKSLNSDEELNIISDKNKIEENEGSDNDVKSISSDLNNFIDIKDNNISMLVNNLEEKNLKKTIFPLMILIKNY